MFNDLIDCGCDSRKEVIGAANWKTDAAVLLIVGAGIAALWVTLKGLE